MSTPGPRVQVVVAVHTTRRPLARAVASVLDGGADDAEVVVVCHGLPVADVAAGLPEGHRARVRWLEHTDGVASPAGPFTAGLRAADAEFVSLLGSDDALTPGAVSSWLALADRTGADAVLARLVRGPARVPVSTPPTRPGRTRDLDLVADRLAYRSAPLGLVRTSRMRALGLHLVPGVPVGEDVPFVTRLWAQGRIAYDRGGPPYVIGEDGAERTTQVTRPVVQELAFVRHLLGEEWYLAAPARVRTAVATKVVRIHVFGLVLHRPDPGWWTPRERGDLAAVTREVLAAGPGAQRPLSRADRSLLDACLDPSVATPELLRRARARRRHGTPATLVPRDLRFLLHREAPARFMGASLLACR